MCMTKISVEALIARERKLMPKAELDLIKRIIKRNVNERFERVL